MSSELFKGFGVNISKSLDDGFKPGMPTITLVSRVLQAEDPTDLSGRPSYTETNNSCRGFIDTYNAARFGGDTTISEGTRIILIFANSLPSGVIPKSEDRVIAEGSTHHITGPIVRDPASATYVCALRA
jgi:hypothetical protein